MSKEMSHLCPWLIDWLSYHFSIYYLKKQQSLEFLINNEIILFFSNYNTAIGIILEDIGYGKKCQRQKPWPFWNLFFKHFYCLYEFVWFWIISMLWEWIMKIWLTLTTLVVILTHPSVITKQNVFIIL